MKQPVLFVPRNLRPYIGGGGISECCMAGNFPSLSFMKAKICSSQSPTRKEIVAYTPKPGTSSIYVKWVQRKITNSKQRSEETIS
jgi:hypothetical protein